ncbi:hypothetical protein GBAR_LOCUS7948, partial [Geodia barretti]
MQSNHSELEYKYPTHLVPLANLFVEKVQYTREPLRSHVNDPYTHFASSLQLSHLSWCIFRSRSVPIIPEGMCSQSDVGVYYVTCTHLS